MQPKKSRDYSKQRINTYGECPSSSRKNIRLRKAQRNRQARRRLDALLRAGAGDLDEVSTALPRPGWFRKVPDTPLGIVVVQRLLRRHANGAMTRESCLARISRVEARFPLPGWLKAQVDEVAAKE